MPDWLHDEEALAQLHRETRDYLKRIYGTGRELALKGRPWPRRGWGAFEVDPAYPVQLFYGPVEYDEFLLSIRDPRRRLFLRGPGGEQTLKQFLELATSKDIRARRAAAAWAHALGDALDPPRRPGQPSDLDGGRILTLYRWLRRINTARRRHLLAFITPPPADWLPAFVADGGDKIKMDDQGWPHLAAIEALAAMMGLADSTIEGHLKRARGRPRR